MSPIPSLRNLIVAGLAAELAFEVYAWFVSPLVFGVVLQPANLVVALAQIWLGLALPYWVGFLIHFTIGAVGFSVFVLLVHLSSRLHIMLSGALAGVALWFIAQGMLAPAVGRSFMMGFGAYTQSSFVGHVGMTMVVAFVLLKLGTSEKTGEALKRTGASG